MASCKAHLASTTAGSQNIRIKVYLAAMLQIYSYLQ